MTKEELMKDIASLEAKLSKSRNISEKAVLVEQIKLDKLKIKKLEEKPLVKDYIPTKDAPSIADRKSKKSGSITRGMINGHDAIRVDI